MECKYQRKGRARRRHSSRSIEKVPVSSDRPRPRLFLLPPRQLLLLLLLGVGVATRAFRRAKAALAEAAAFDGPIRLDADALGSQ